MLTRDAILLSVPKFEPFEAFGGKCSIRVLTGRERDIVGKLSREASDKKEYAGYREKIVVLVLGDETGVRIFKDEDATLLAEKDSLELERIVAAGLKLNKLTGDDYDEAKKA